MALINLINKLPQALDNLIITGTNGGITLDWDSPVEDSFWSTEIWRSTINDRSTATLVTSNVGTNFYDTHFSITNYYYWIRAKDKFGNVNGEWFPADPLAGTPGQSVPTVSSGVSSGGGSGSSSGFIPDVWRAIGGSTGIISNIDIGSDLLTVKGVMNIDITPTITGDDDITIDLRFSIVDETDSHTVVDEINTAVMQIDVSAGYPMPTILPVYLTTHGNYVDTSHTFKFIVEYMVKSSGNPNGSVGYTYTNNQLVVSGN